MKIQGGQSSPKQFKRNEIFCKNGLAPKGIQGGRSPIFVKREGAIGPPLPHDFSKGVPGHPDATPLKFRPIQRCATMKKIYSGIENATAHWFEIGYFTSITAY